MRVVLIATPAAKSHRKFSVITATAASLLRVFDLRAELDEIAFHKAGLNYSVCGYEMGHQEIPVGFPGILTVGMNNYANGE